MKFPAKGTLSKTSFIEILKEAAQDSLTGMVRMENGPIIKVVYLQKGSISFASSNEKSDRLTEVLKRAEKLTPEQVDDAQSRLKPNVSIGKTLVELGYISAKELLWGARAQVDRILHQLLFWSEGKYQILEGALPKEIIHLNLPVPSVIFEGITKTQNREWILQNIGSPDAIYALASDFQEQNETLKLPVQQIISHLNGRRSLHDIAEKSDLDTFDICKTVVALEHLGLVQAIQDVPLQMDLSAPETERPVETTEMVEAPGAIQEEAKELGQVLQLPTVEDLLTAPAAESAQEVEPPGEHEHLLPVAEKEPEMQPATVIMQQELEEKEKEKQRTKEVEIPDRRVPLQNMLQRDSGAPATGPVPRWKIPITTVLVIVTVALGVVFYIQRQSTTPEVAPSGQSTLKPRADSVAPAVEPLPSTSPVDQTESFHPPALDLPPDAPLRLLHDGKIAEAAKSYRENVTKRNFGYSIQLVIACQEKTVQDTYRLMNYSKDIIVLPLSYKGQDCYRVLYGQFRAREYAQTAIQSLPEVFLKQSSPATVVALSMVR